MALAAVGHSQFWEGEPTPPGPSGDEFPANRAEYPWRSAYVFAFVSLGGFTAWLSM